MLIVSLIVIKQITLGMNQEQTGDKVGYISDLHFVWGNSWEQGGADSDINSD